MNILETENLLSEEQNGFRRNRRTTDNIYILKEIIDNAKREKKVYYCAFLDIEKAYSKQRSHLGNNEKNGTRRKNNKYN